MSVNFEINLKNRLYIKWALSEHFSDFFGETQHFSGKNGALRWSILVAKQKHNVQKPISRRRYACRPNHVTGAQGFFLQLFSMTHPFLPFLILEGDYKKQNF